MADPKVMVVEDDRIIAGHIQVTLNSLGYSVTALVSSGEEAVKKAVRDNPDIVLMDIVLKGEMDGVEAASLIRSRLGIPIVFLTAFSDQKILERAKLTEPFGYLIKPFEDRELHSVLQIALYKHRMEKRLKESEEWLSTTLNSIGDAVIATDTLGYVIFMNPVAQELTGWKQDEILGKSVNEVFNIINEKTGELAENPVTKVIQKGTIVGLANHTVLVTKDGKKVPIDDSAAPIKNERGETVGVVLVFRDITERKQKEEKIREQNEFLKNVLESLPHPFYIIDAEDYSVKLANSCAQVGDLSKKQTCYSLIHKQNQPCNSNECPCPLEEVKKTKKPAVIEHIHQINGEPGNFEVHGSPIFDANGNVIQMIEYFLDITKRRRAEEKLAALLSEQTG